MNTSQLKSFAKEARSILLEGVGLKLQYWGFNEKGEVTEEPQSVSGGVIFRGKPIDDPGIDAKWRALKQAVNNRGVRDVIEEATYTWFNRFMAIRILSKNGYESPQVEYTSEDSKVPQILTRARRGQYDFLSSEEKKQLEEVITDYSKENDAFGILIRGYCHSHPLISQVFGNLDDFTELLLPDNILSDSGFIHLLNTSTAISDEDYRKVELIGWLYQFYISERKDEVFAAFKKNKKAEAEDIPAATQIFTPNWIVKYMVQNTVGKLWLDLKPDSPVKDNLKYLVENESAVADPIIKEAADIKLLDPAVGSGHILVEGFDVLYACFMEEYYTPEEAVKSILTQSLYGLDLDKRAMQLARFAVLLKAAKQYPEIINDPIMPRIYAMPEQVHFSRQEILDFLGEDHLQQEDAFTDAIKLMHQAKNLGSIMQFELEEEEKTAIFNRWESLESTDFRSMNEEAVLMKMRPYLDVLKVLTQRYESVVANPPYLFHTNMNLDLKRYVGQLFPLSKQDLFAVFMEVCISYARQQGLIGTINQHSWMFISRFEGLRKMIISEYNIINMLHLGPRAFLEVSGEKVQSVAFTFQRSSPSSNGVYFRLVDEETAKKKEASFLSKKNIFQDKKQTDFINIPGSPIAYWVSDNIIKLFTWKSLENFSVPQTGLQTSDNNRFLRNWFEVKFANISLSCLSNDEASKSKRTWFPYNKGGSRKWAGDYESVVNWKNDGHEIREYNSFLNSTRSSSIGIGSVDYFFKEGITTKKIGTKGFSARHVPNGFIFDSGGPLFFSPFPDLLLAFFNSKVTSYLLSIINPTLNFQVGDIKKLPFEFEYFDVDLMQPIIKSTQHMSVIYWNKNEISFDYQKNGLVIESNSLDHSLSIWFDQVTQDFFQIHHNEEALNRIFIDIYGLKEELTPEVPLKDITILQAELDRKQLVEDEKVLRKKGIGIKAKYEGLPLIPEGYELPIDRDEVMRQFISYAIGCWMGRYRLDEPGLHIAHPNPSAAEIAPYTIPSPLHGGKNQVTFNIREDAIIPLMGKSGSFPQDAANLLSQFIQYIWGGETYTENINFLEECLDKDLEKYLVKDFWKDHCSRYKKRPIYWLFSSAKGAFQVLVYMHRMNRFTVEKIRSEYLLPHMKYLQTQIDLLTKTGQDPKSLDGMIKDLEECESYDLVLKDKADQQIAFDLDDGVQENYKLFEGVVAAIK
jgi:hypothetical protein